MRQEPTDNEFARTLRAAKRGRADALDRLVRLVDRRVVAFLRARGAAEADELANEVLIALCRSIDSFEGNLVQFRAWVFTIARNRLIDDRRRAGRRISTVGHDPGDLVEVAGGAADDIPLELTERAEALLALLTEEQREIVTLRVIADLSVEETAQATGRSEGAVRAMHHRAMRVLRDSLVSPSY